MQTTTTRPSRARKQPAAPLSTAAAKLIEQIQAEALANLLAELSAKDAITVLHGFDVQTKSVFFGNTSIKISDARGNVLTMHRHFEEPEQWRASIYMAGHWHPAHWYGNQTMIDANGVQWSRSFEPMVCNDFGDLVEVAA